MLDRLFGRKPAATVPLVLYTRSECSLCDEMKHGLRNARVGFRYELEEVDIGADPDLEERYGRSIPVLKVGDRTAFKGRLDGDFRPRLERLAREWLGEHGR